MCMVCYTHNAVVFYDRDVTQYKFADKRVDYL